jgi:hypothetical protein
MPSSAKLPFRFIACALALGSPAAIAEPIEDLARCYVEKATEADQLVLARWMFAALAQHGAVTKYAKVAEADLEAVTVEAAGVMQRLVTADCVEQARAAAAAQGLGAVSQALQVLGQVASRVLLTDQAVGRSLNAVNAHIDEKKVLAAVDPDGKLRESEAKEAAAAEKKPAEEKKPAAAPKAR